MSWHRPFVVGFVVLLLFLSLSNDNPANVENDTTTATTKSTEDGLKKGVKEQIIYDLSLTNESLELEVKKLRQYVLDVRRAARESGCSKILSDDILTLYPELNQEIGDADDSVVQLKPDKVNASSNSGPDADAIAPEQPPINTALVDNSEQQNGAESESKQAGKAFSVNSEEASDNAATRPKGELPGRRRRHLL